MVKNQQIPAQDSPGAFIWTIGFAGSTNKYKAQNGDDLSDGKLNGQAVVFDVPSVVKTGEAEISENLFYPRHNAFREFFRDFVDNGGDGVMLSSATTTSAGSYSVVLIDWDGVYSNDNSDDRPLTALLFQCNCAFNGGPTPIRLIDWLAP